jgi:hypothetical protein
VFRKKFTIERNGHDGPLEVRLADKQARHLQGVSGPVLAVAANAKEFEYPLTLPPWMETGRTSRACVMALGKVKVDGTEHVVSFTSQAQNEQMIAVVETGQLGLELGRASLAIRPGGSAELPLSVRRGKGLNGAVRIELVATGASAEPVTIAAGKGQASLTVKLGAKPAFTTRAVLIRATIESKDGPVVAEASAELVVE